MRSEAYAAAVRSRTSRPWIAAPLALFLAAGTVAQDLDPDGKRAEEYALKAAFLYHFTKFVEWPAADDEGDAPPFVVAVVGRDPFGATLEETLEGKRVGQRRIAVARYSPERVGRCEILFVPHDERDEMAKVLRAIRGKPVLVVGEADGFARRGGVVNFYLENDRVGLEINPEAAKRADLEISSRLLKLARIVRET